TQGIEFHRPQKSSADIESVISTIRKVSPAFVQDRSLSSDITRVAAMIAAGRFCEYAASVLPSLRA
ncbi:MAG: histidine ammonia-lyase, partial [Gammaproteobacteria bacterium]|nr:histidine ammonia-lyase [Gammaproteobacteria bacterium]